MERRRALSAQYTPEGYIKSGLVLWLDGKARGGETGKWVDRVGGNICTLIGNCEELTSGVRFSATSENTQYGEFSQFVQISKDVGTVEWAVQLNQKSATGRPILSMGNLMMGGSVASDTAGLNCPCMRYYEDPNNNMDFYRFRSVDSRSVLVYTMSGSAERAMCNGTLAEKFTVTSWPNRVGNEGRLASRGAGNPFQGVIFSIRLYKRHLSMNEMLNNQRIDNKRFNLGLSI